MLGRAVPLRPAVCTRYHAEVVADDAVAFVSENSSALVRDPVALNVVPLIDGRRTSDEIARTLTPLIETQRVHEALGSMVQAGLVVEAADLPVSVSALWAEIGVSEFRAREVLDGFTVGIETLSDIPLEALHEAVSDFGFAVAQNPDAPSLKVVIVDDYLDSRLAEIDRRARATGQRWFLVKPAGVNVWVGPGFVPGRTACWHCLADRLRRNRPVDDYLHRHQNRRLPLPISRARSRMAAYHAYSMAATQIARWVGCISDQPSVEATLIILETLRLMPSWHTVRRRPQCGSCGDPKLAVPTVGRPELATGATPIVSRDGREHSEPPEAVFDRYAHLVSPVTGVVSAVLPSPWNSQSPLRSYTAGHNGALASDTLQIAGDSLRMHSSGKGRSDGQARTSALCEALERASGVYTGDEPGVHDTLTGLGDPAVDPRDCMLFSDRQYRERDRWLASGSGFQVVPWPFEPDMPLDWSPVWSLTQDRIRYLPTSYLYYGYPHDDERFVASADSNGNAAGATLAEACLQGLYELIERDSVALWWYNRIRRPGVSLEGLERAWIDELRTFYERSGREFWLLDLTSDLEVPAFAALSRRLEAPTEDIVIGFGAHHDPCVAAARALGEMNQFMPAVMDIGIDGTTQYHVRDAETIRWWTTAHVTDQPYLSPLTSSPPTQLDRSPQPELMTADERFRTVVGTLETRGLEVLVLDQTRPDIGLPVAKVLVPGLRHYWARFAPGRLFDVPVELGWIARPTPEQHLNPIAMFV
jgi:bacteriocin biosynthesis cyclodehydratase domain-containing protein